MWSIFVVDDEPAEEEVKKTEDVEVPKVVWIDEVIIVCTCLCVSDELLNYCFILFSLDCGRNRTLTAPSEQTLSLVVELLLSLVVVLLIFCVARIDNCFGCRCNLCLVVLRAGEDQPDVIDDPERGSNRRE